MNSPYKNNDVITLKLISGEEVVTKLVAETPEEYEVVYPLTLVPNQRGVGLTATVIGVRLDDNTVTVRVRKTAVVLHGQSREEMRDAWYEFATGIKPSSGKILLG